MATLIFFTHLATLLALVFLGVAYMAGTGGGHLWMNLEKPLPDEEITTLYFPGNVLSALFFGTCTGMLGVSGFESSSQFVEQQKPGRIFSCFLWLLLRGCCCAVVQSTSERRRASGCTREHPPNGCSVVPLWLAE